MNLRCVGFGFALLLVLTLAACSGQTEVDCPQPVSNLVSPLAAPVFDVWREGNSATYHADAAERSFAGTLKSVVESAAFYLTQNGGGTVRFRGGDYDLGQDWFELNYIEDVRFVGQGVDVTVLRNAPSAAADSEVFDCTRCNRLVIQDLTVSAGGPPRSTSDALDFDGGNDFLIERVKVTSSRGRGIVFDGKGVNDDGPQDTLDSADRNIIRDCVVTGIQSHGIELLASSHNLIENCTITDVGGTGIEINKASANAQQPNKRSNDNVVRNNRIENVGRDGVKVNSSDRNLITGNTILNSSDDVAGLDGVRIVSYDGVGCDDNVVALNTATDTQGVKTQKYGLKILSPNCHRTVVDNNRLAGNLLGGIYDQGTATSYPTRPDDETPAAPARLTVAASEPFRVDLSWTAATDDVAVTGYEVQRNGDLAAALGNVTFYADTEVQPGSTYQYAVRARDAVGNWSPFSALTPATTPGCRVRPGVQAGR